MVIFKSNNPHYSRTAPCVQSMNETSEHFLENIQTCSTNNEKLLANTKLVSYIEKAILDLTVLFSRTTK